jgi:hypothetical protein
MSSKILALKVGLVLAMVCLASQASFAADKDNNPPGPKGGPGSNWENKPGPQGGPGASPNRHWDKDNNPPGPTGGPGSNWEKNDYPHGWEQGKKEGWNNPKHPKPNIDFNHDGVVDENEKKTAYEKYIAPNKEKREEWKEKREDRKEKREEKREAWKDRVDTNDDGKVDKVERHQAREQWKENHPGAGQGRKPAPKN